MSVKIRGLKKLQDELEAKLGTKKMNVISDRALTAAAKVFMTILKDEFEIFADKRHSINEMTMTPIYFEKGVRLISIKWKGPKGRYRIIHLNELGTVKNPDPKGKGVIARTLISSEAAYKKAIKAGLEGGF